MKMSVLLVLGLISVALLSSSACTSSPTTTPDIPRYTADQVIYIAQQSNPGTGVSLAAYSASFTSKYEGDGLWSIKKEIGYTQGNTFHVRWTKYGLFNEMDGHISWADLPFPIPKIMN